MTDRAQWSGKEERRLVFSCGLWQDDFGIGWFATAFSISASFLSLGRRDQKTERARFVELQENKSSTVQIRWHDAVGEGTTITQTDCYVMRPYCNGVDTLSIRTAGPLGGNNC